MGFKIVDDQVIYSESPSQSIILTHTPVPIKNDQVNIHGHIHGSRCYWNVDWHNHYDVWDNDFYPITIKECLEALKKGLYTATTEIHKNY
jgi:hypothetical protein